MKYDVQLNEVRGLMQSAFNVLIALPVNPQVDELSAALALMLSLQKNGKKVTIVSESQVKVENANLFGIGEIKNSLPQMQEGNLIITLGGVVDPTTQKPPALESLDWFPTGSDLNVVFKVVAGQRFQPSQITPHYENSSFNMIFTIGAASLDLLGSIYQNNQDIFAKTYVVNIDKSTGNSQFGKTNIVDTITSSLSEMLGDIIPSLQLPVDPDIATNILTGIFTATSNLQSDNVSADTYMIVSSMVKNGGKKPAFARASVGEATTINVPVSQPILVQTESVNEPTTTSTQAAPGFDLSKVFNAPVNLQPPVPTESAPQQASPVTENFTVPPVVGQDDNKQSPEEYISGERAMGGEETVKPEADWLTPKIFKGSSIG